VDGVIVSEQAIEKDPQYFPPWNLRDMRSPVRSTTILTPNTSSEMVVWVRVSDSQPTRLAAAIGGVPSSERRSRLSWWAGSEPALPFQPFDSVDILPTKIRATIPPGALSVTVRSRGPVTSAFADSVEVPVNPIRKSQSLGELVHWSTIDVDGHTGDLTFVVSSLIDVGPTAGVLEGPLTWSIGEGRARSRAWNSWGLRDYSGMVRYSTDFAFERVSGHERLRLVGLEGTASVTLNNEHMGFCLLGSDLIELSSLTEGRNLLQIECANTLANHYQRFPSPYAKSQPPSGGFLRAEVLCDAGSQITYL
jgi:hypothetical protein